MSFIYASEQPQLSPRISLSKIPRSDSPLRDKMRIRKNSHPLERTREQSPEYTERFINEENAKVFVEKRRSGSFDQKKSS
jgi:hypothetical protein